MFDKYLFKDPARSRRRPPHPLPHGSLLLLLRLRRPTRRKNIIYEIIKTAPHSSTTTHCRHHPNHNTPHSRTHTGPISRFSLNNSSSSSSGCHANRHLKNIGQGRTHHRRAGKAKQRKTKRASHGHRQHLGSTFTNPPEIIRPRADSSAFAASVRDAASSTWRAAVGNRLCCLIISTAPGLNRYCVGGLQQSDFSSVMLSQ